MLDCLKNCNHNSIFMSANSIANKFHIHKVTAQMQIRKLFKWGFIDRIEKDGVFHYGVIRVGEATTHTPKNGICYPNPNTSSNSPAPAKEKDICYPTIPNLKPAPLIEKYHMLPKNEE